MPENAKSPSEPSMEEIIASISRIITDEKTSVEPVRPVPGEKSEILELTEVVDEDGSVRRVAPEAGSSERRPTGSAAAVDPAAANATARSGPGPHVPRPRLSRGSNSAANAFCRQRRREPLRPRSPSSAHYRESDAGRASFRLEVSTAHSKTSCAICCGRCYRLGSTKISPGSSSGWSEKRSPASLVRQGCADPSRGPVTGSAFCGQGCDRLLDADN